MILVTLGTQDKSFKRLLQAIEEQIVNGKITQKVIVQAGFTEFESKNMEIIKYLPLDKFEQLVKESELLITHAGVGSIMTGINNNKKVIAAARLKEYKEHTNNHQLQILKRLSEDGYILALDDFSKLDEVIESSKKFVPKTFNSNTDKFINIIKEYIENN